MVRIVLLRPGTTSFDEQRRIKGNLDIPLNDFGTDQIVRASHELTDQGLQLVYSAACRAAEETGKILASHLRIKHKTLASLLNFDPGLWEGRQIDEVRQRQPRVFRTWQDSPESVCPPEGEMLSDVKERVFATLEMILKKHRNGVVGLVLPEPLASVAAVFLTNRDLGDLWAAENDCGFWESIDVREDFVLNSCLGHS
ncbi:MAG: histidine phosphatase family protein [Planctomycetales bacterium]|nr:histidine phosphatase family protein [Planctomycetales bacterium]